MTDSMIRYVGLDVHKRVVEACIVDQAGNVVHRERFVAGHVRPQQVGHGPAVRCGLQGNAVARPEDLRGEQAEDIAVQHDAIDLELARRGHDSPQVKLLMTLPGVDVTTAEAILAAWGDIRRFPDADHAASYLGLVPSTKQSANRCYHGPITKQGNSQARWMLIEAAQHLDKQAGPLGHFFRRLLRKKCRNVAVVAGARKLAMIGWLMLAHDEPYRYAVPRSTETKLAKLRVKATGKRRTGGVAKGQKAMATQPGQAGGTRRIRALGDVCDVEGLPSLKPLSPGEQRTVRSARCETFVATITQPQLVPRRSSTKAGKSGNHDAKAPQAAVAAADTAREGKLAASSTRAASCPVQARTLHSAGRFRPHPAGEQGDVAPPPAPPTLFSVPKQGRTKAKSKNRS